MDLLGRYCGQTEAGQTDGADSTGASFSTPTRLPGAPLGGTQLLAR
jgi:hypothetical protein